MKFTLHEYLLLADLCLNINLKKNSVDQACQTRCEHAALLMHSNSVLKTHCVALKSQINKLQV
jgi:hypothetical protein